VFEGVEFDWDTGNRLKCQKYGVLISDIEALFRTNPRVVLDVRHSLTETRMIAIGRGQNDRMIFVGFTMRQRDGDQLIRPITARYMREKEVRRYAQTGSAI